MLKMTNVEYSKYVKEMSPKSHIVRDTTLAYLSGGLICAGGQALSNLYVYIGLSKEQAALSVSMTLIFIAALLTALHIYDSIAKYCGGGMLVPITGFSNSMVSPAMEFKSEGFVAGMAAKMFNIAGPVLVFGITASVIYGIILVIFSKS